MLFLDMELPGHDGIYVGNMLKKKILAAGYADLIAFGRPFIANPDLPQRLAHHWPLNDVSDPATLFGGTAVGYTDYPTYNLCEEK